MKYNKIALIGMPGSGKTTTGKLLAKNLNIDFYDTDSIFENNFYSINDFFKKVGEEKFRLEEEKILKKITQKEKFIISTGGGIILKETNRNLLFNSDMFTVYLKTSPEELYKRTQFDNSRPLLSGSNDKLANLNTLLNNRKMYYNKANLTIITDNKTIEDVAKEITENIL